MRECLNPGPDCPYTPAQVYRCLGCSPQCGRCARTIRAIMDAALPSVHSACTTRCNAKCPLAADGETVGSFEVTNTVDAVETAEGLDIHETIEIHEHVSF